MKSLNPDQKARVILDVDAGRSATSARPADDRPFNILLVGDFSGSASSTNAPNPADLRGRRALEVDRDNVDDVLAALRPAVQFSLAAESTSGAAAQAGPPVSINFRSLDDFHPDRLIQIVPLLRSLDELRDEARDGRLTGATEREPASINDLPAPDAPANRGGGSLLDQIVDSSSATPPTAARSSSAPVEHGSEDPNDLHGYIRHILKPHLVDKPDARVTALVAQIEDTMTSVLRALLHGVEFQQLESHWRGLAFLVHRLETGERLKVFIVDVSARELAADLAPDRDMEDSFVGRLLRDGAHGGGNEASPFAVVSLLSTFSDSAEDAALLGRLAAIARRAKASLLAAAAPALAGLDTFATEPEPGDVRAPSGAEWRALRQSGDARFVGLALPRFLLRAPYDPREEPCDTLAFEEMSSPPAHNEYLWGNPAIVCSLLLGEAFTAAGWRMRPGSALEVSGLPVHLYREAGATEAKPCAELLITDRVAALLMRQGVMPVLSMKGGDAVRVARFQSIADPESQLCGPWSDGY